MSINFNNKHDKACYPVHITAVYSTIYIYGIGNHIDFCLQESGDLGMCGSQTDWNIARILLLLDDLLRFYQVFDGNLIVVCLLLEELAHLLGTALL